MDGRGTFTHIRQDYYSALGQLHVCPGASEINLKDMVKIDHYLTTKKAQTVCLIIWMQSITNLSVKFQ